MGWLMKLPALLLALAGVLLRLLWPLLLGATAYVLLRRRKADKAAGGTGDLNADKEPSFSGPVYTVNYQEVPVPQFSTRPDTPLPFGYKTAWLALRCAQPGKVAAALGGTRTQRANWGTGLPPALERDDLIFVSPELDGWVLAVGQALFDLAEQPETLAAMAGQFEELQYFASHRVAGGYCWARYRGQTCLRAYGVADGQLLRSEGALTPEEQALGFAAFPTEETEEPERWPDEEDVLAIAAAWGIDPRFEGTHYPPDLGRVCQ